MRGRAGPSRGRRLQGDEAIGRHLTHLFRRNLRPNTIKFRAAVLRRLQRHISPKSVLRATHDDLEDFLARLEQPRSRAVELTQVRGFYRWAHLEGIIPRDPTIRLERPRLPRSLPRPIPDDLLAKAFTDPPERVRPWLYLAAYAGLRACEISQLRGEAVMLDRAPPVIFIETSKGGKQRSVPCAPILAGELGGLPHTGWLFPRFDGQSGPTPPHLVSQITNRYLHDIGIRHTLHTLRHWFATKAYVATGRDLRATQELMGHESPASTQVYTWVDPGELAEAVGRLPEL